MITRGFRGEGRPPGIDGRVPPGQPFVEKIDT